MKPLTSPSGFKQAMLITVISLLTMSCTAHKNGVRLAFEGESEAEYASICLQIAEIGDYQALKKSFDTNVSEIIRLSNFNPAHTRSRIEQLAADASADAQRLKALAAPEWNTENWPATYQWTLAKNDFVAPNQESIAIQSLEIRDSRIYGQAGGERAHTLETVINGDSALIRLVIPSTAFELCQLSRALAVHIRAHYESRAITHARDFILTVQEN